MFLLVMRFDAMLFPFKSMLNLRLTLVQRHRMVMRWLVQFSDQSDFLFLVMVRFGRLSSDLYLNLVLLGLSVDSWLMVWLWLRSFMVVDVRLDVSNSMVHHVGFCHSLLLRRSRVHIMHRDRCQHKRLINHLKLGMMDHRLGLLHLESSLYFIVLNIRMLSHTGSHRSYQQSGSWMGSLLFMDMVSLASLGEFDVVMVVISSPFLFKDLSFSLMVDRLDKVGAQIPLDLSHHMAMVVVWVF